MNLFSKITGSYYNFGNQGKTMFQILPHTSSTSSYNNFPKVTQQAIDEGKKIIISALKNKFPLATICHSDITAREPEFLKSYDPNYFPIRHIYKLPFVYREEIYSLNYNVTINEYTLSFSCPSEKISRAVVRIASEKLGRKPITLECQSIIIQKSNFSLNSLNGGFCYNIDILADTKKVSVVITEEGGLIHWDPYKKSTKKLV